MDQQHEQLVDYTRQRLQKGDSEEAIRQTFQQYNLSQQLTDQLLSEAKISVESVGPTASADTAEETPSAVSQVVLAHDQTKEAIQPASPYQSGIAATVEPDDQANNTRTGDNYSATSKYRVFQAVNDALMAIKSNLTNVALAFLIGALLMALGVAAMFASMFLVAPWMMGNPDSMDGSMFDMASIAKAFAVGIIFNIALGVIATLVLTLISLAIKDGVDSGRRSFGQLSKDALKRFGWVLLAMVQLWLITFGPIIVLALLGLVASMAEMKVLVFLIGIVAVIGGFGWAIMAILRYSLMPYVAMFEPEVKMSSLAKRTFQLVRRGGQWFTFKLILLATAVNILVSTVLTSLSEGVVIGIVSVVASLAVLVIFYASMVMLYINQRNLVKAE